MNKPKTIELTIAQLTIIEQHSRKHFPDECCGFLLGTLINNSKQVQMLLPANNAAEKIDRRRRFLITSGMYLHAARHATEHQKDILGFYHSHPNASAQPSHYDLDHAWVWYSYLIVSIIDGKPEDILSWTLREDRSAFDQENIKIIS